MPHDLCTAQNHFPSTGFAVLLIRDLNVDAFQIQFPKKNIPLRYRYYAPPHVPQKMQRLKLTEKQFQQFQAA
jgi:hypothetical protein